MPEAQRQRDVFDLSGGLNTELHDLAWPDGFSKDEANYELLSDGTRRRRKGLAEESSAGTKLTLDENITGTTFVQSYKWMNVGGDPDKTFMVHQIGQDLYFSANAAVMSGTWHSKAVALEPYSAETPLVIANIRDKPVRFAQGRGHLFITGPFLQPFYVEYTASTDTFESWPITVAYRDFEGIEDGISLGAQPTGTISAAHRYNLRNRGWKEADLVAYKAALSKNPAKNAVWHRQYYREAKQDVLTAVEMEGTRQVDYTKFDQEVFGNSSAPMGSVFLNPFDTAAIFDITSSGVSIPVTTWDLDTDNGDGTWLIKLTTAAHSFVNPEQITILGQMARYNKTQVTPRGRAGRWRFNGTHTVEAAPAPTGTEFWITVNAPKNFSSWDDQYFRLGEIGGTLAVTIDGGEEIEKGFKAIGFHAGRIWYAGLNNGQFADHVFFSRLVETPDAYGQCHQRNDPTDEEFNAITPADGGVLVVPGMQGVTDMMTIGNSLILLGTDGAWEIAGGRGAVFTATQFGVRKMTEASFNSPTGAIAVEDAGVATGPSGIYQFAPNQFTGQLEAKNMIENTIQTKWNGYTTSQQAHVQVAYDDAKRRMYFMLGADSTTHHYTEMLILDVPKVAWFRYTFNTPQHLHGLISMMAVSDADNSDDNQKMKFLYHDSVTTVQVADFEQTDYIDYDAVESPVPYLLTGDKPLSSPCTVSEPRPGSMLHSILQSTNPAR